MNNININELIEQLTDEIRLSKYKTWDSALVKGDNGLYHAITTDEDVILSTEDNSKETSWLCDYIELVCPENIQIILDALEAAQQYAKSRDEENQDLMLTIGRLRVEREQLEASQPVAPEGWKLVPIEPTEDMIVDGFESEPDKAFSDAEEWDKYKAMSGCAQAAHRAKLCWSAMLNAAPALQEG